MNGDVVVIGVILAMGMVGCGCVVPRGGRRSGSGGEANCVRFDEVYFKVLPNLVGFRLGIPADEGTVVEARTLDRADGFIDELWLGEWWFRNKGGDETIFESVKKCFDRVDGVPFRVESGFVCLFFRWSWAAIGIA